MLAYVHAGVPLPYSSSSARVRPLAATNRLACCRGRVRAGLALVLPLQVDAEGLAPARPSLHRLRWRRRERAIRGNSEAWAQARSRPPPPPEGPPPAPSVPDAGVRFKVFGQ